MDTAQPENAVSKGGESFPRTGGELVRSLSLFTTTMIVIGGVIGSGIFRKPGVMAGQVGSAELLLLVWLMAGAFTLFGALTNAEIAAMIPETGGQYIFFERIYGPFVAYLYGWAAFVVIQTASITAVAYVFAEHAAEFVKLPELSGPMAAFSMHLPFIGDIMPFKEIGIKGLAAGLIAALTVINYLGARLGGVVQNIFTVAKVAAMLLLVLGAFLLPNGGRSANLTASSPLFHREGLGLWTAIAAALQGAFWAYDGWNKVTYLAGEVKEPQRNLPRSLFLGMSLVTALYLLMNLAYAFVLPIDEMAQSKLVAADVAERCLRGGGRWIAVAVMISTFGTANAIILASARVYFAMARRNVFPIGLGAAHPRFHTPAASLIAQGTWGILCAPAQRTALRATVQSSRLSLRPVALRHLRRAISGPDRLQRRRRLPAIGRGRQTGHHQFGVRSVSGVDGRAHLLLLPKKEQPGADAAPKSMISPPGRGWGRVTRPFFGGAGGIHRPTLVRPAAAIIHAPSHPKASVTARIENDLPPL